jgi:uncharacterized protein
MLNTIRHAGNGAAAFFAFAALSFLSTPSAHAYDHEGLARDALQRHIRPGYAAFDKAAADLNAATNSLCETPGADGLAKTRAAFAEAALSWARIEHIGFGPISDEKRHDRLLFWPDPKGIARRQVAAIIDSADETAFDARIAGKSVAVQGFTALDIVLFGPGSADLETPAAKGSPRCRYSVSLTRNIASIATAASAGWAASGEFEHVWLQPGAGNSVYLSAKETTQALLQTYVTGLELLRDQRLKGQLGMQRTVSKAIEPMLPNSGLAVPFLQANIEGLKSLLSDGGFIARQTDPLITDPEKQVMTVLGSIRDELTRAADAARTAGKLSATPFKDEAARQKLISMGFPLKNAYATGGQAIADQASITMGFSALDGD